jgi:signal transduction histidine kinase
MTLVDPTTAGSLPVEAVAGTVLSEAGELMWIVTILHDLTETIERARLYEQVKRASEELEAKVQTATIELAQQNELLRRQRFEVEQASALKSQFLANMSHEFRTPLNAILGYTQMLMQGVTGALTEEQHTDLERIDSNGRHLMGLINDILDLSRIEAGHMPVHTATINVSQLVKEVLGELDPIIQRSRLRVGTRLSSRLPTFESDRQKVKQILLNLIGNALKFTRRGNVQIVARPAGQARTVSITVKDTGIGISRANLERIFEDFRQLDTSPSRGYSGTGLGLSICRRLAVILGGTLTVKSQVGRGSAFTLALPVVGADR